MIIILEVESFGVFAKTAVYSLKNPFRLERVEILNFFFDFWIPRKKLPRHLWEHWTLTACLKKRKFYFGYGYLCATVFTEDIAKANRVARKIRAGTGKIKFEKKNLFFKSG